MADQIPLKVRRTIGDTDALAEFEPGDSVPVNQGGTGATDGVTALANLGGLGSAHSSNTSNPHSVTANQTGAIATSQRGVANGVASLDAGGKIPASQIPAIAIPSMHVVTNTATRNALVVQEGDEAKQLDDGSHWIYDGATWHTYPVPSPFGQNYSEINEFTTSVTTSTTFQNKASLTFNVINGFKYRYGWSYQWNHDSASNDFEARIMVGGVEYQRHVQEPKDPAGSSYNGSGTNQRHMTSGFDYYTATFTGSLTLELEYRTGTGGVKSAIFEARIEQWRVE